LTALGWGEEIDKIPEGGRDLTYHKLVKVPQLLTDRSELHPLWCLCRLPDAKHAPVWANIRGTMIEYMEKMKADRLARELKQLHTQRRSDAVKLLRAYKAECVPFTDVMPEPLDFYAFGLIKEIINQPPDITVDSQSFSHLMPELDGMVEEWRRTILAKFIEEVKVGIVNCSVMLDDNPLDLDNVSDESILQRIRLACTVFSCIPCKATRRFDDDHPRLDFLSDSSSDLPIWRPLRTRPLWFPRVLGHRCLTKQRRRGSTDSTTRLYMLGCHRQRWSCDSTIELDQEACEAAVAIVEACWMDPSIATVDDMDQLDERLECLTCLVPGVEDQFHRIFGWRSAVRSTSTFYQPLE
jgi:hypothetical protein